MSRGWRAGATAALAAGLVTTACTTAPSPGQAAGCYDAPASCVAPGGARHPFVVDTLTMPATALQALDLGVNVDGDPQGRVENQLGNIVATMSSVGEIDVQALVDGWLADGTIVLLVDVQAEDLVDAGGVGGRLLYGVDPAPAPCAGEGDLVCGHHLRAGASFAIDDSADVSLLVPGTIRAGLFRGGPVPTHLEVRLPGVLPRPVTLDLIGVRTRSTIDDGGLGQGVLGGALEVGALRTELLPVVVEMVARDCQGVPGACCTAGTPGEQVLRLFSPGDDCQLSLEELEQDDVLAILLEPDVDMLDGATGAYAPRSDGRKESISIGLGFTALPAIVRSGER